MLKALAVIAGVALAIAAAIVLWNTLDGAVLSTALSSLMAFPLATIAAALALVCISFLLAGVCEVAALSEIRTHLGLARPMLVTAIANPIGHALSLPTLSGGALRYRMYTGWGLDRAQIAKVVLLSAMPFLLGVTVLLSAALVDASDAAAQALHAPGAVIVVCGLAGLTLIAGYIACTAVPRISRRLPSLRLTAIQTLCGIVEIVTIAGALYLFMPSELGMSPAGFLIVYLIGVLLGQVSSVPAGLGVLEASMILLLPQVPKAKLIAAAVAYRVVFDLIPLLVALVLLVAYEAGSRRGIIGRWWRDRRIAD